MAGILPDNLQRAIENVTRVPDYTPDLDAISEAMEGQTAKGAYKRILKRVIDFENGLDQQHEVGLTLANFGQSITLSVSAIGYIDPMFVVFHGHTGNGEPIELIQHFSQISFALIRIKRKNPEKPKAPIGFVQ